MITTAKLKLPFFYMLVVSLWSEIEGKKEKVHISGFMLQNMAQNCSPLQGLKDASVLEAAFFLCQDIQKHVAVVKPMMPI